MRWLILALLPLGACARTIVSLSQQPMPVPSRHGALDVIARSNGIATPLPLRGGAYAFGSLDEALGASVAAAATSWADTHARAAGLQLFVDLYQASASRRGDSIVVSLGVRATLRTRQGHVYVAQTQAHCRHETVVDAAHAAPVFYACTSSIGEELAGWLGGIAP